MKIKKLLATSLVVASIFTVGCNNQKQENNSDQSNQFQLEKTISDLQIEIDKLKKDKEVTRDENINYMDITNKETDYDIETLKNINSSDSNVDTMYIYENDIDDVNKFKVVDSVDVSRKLSLNEKLYILCDKIEDAFKLETGEEIALYVEDIIDEKYAVIAAAEKYGMYSYSYRKNELERTLNQPEFKGEWFEKVIVVYDSHSTQ